MGWLQGDQECPKNHLELSLESLSLLYPTRGKSWNVQNLPYVGIIMIFVINFIFKAIKLRNLFWTRSSRSWSLTKYGCQTTDPNSRRERTRA